MKKIVLSLLIYILTSLTIGCTSQQTLTNQNSTETNSTTQEIGSEESKRIDLYVSAMKAAFKEENGGNGFIAVKLDTLEGLSDEAKNKVLKNLSALSSNLYDFEEVKNDNVKFKYDDKGNLQRTIDGTLLSIRLQEYSDNEAIIEITSWFGNLGAVFPKYKATYKDTTWHLELLEMAIS
ncbi:hypothetical protein [Crassaminicella profunda]|uniref:hypothetical protein n=1 Tax=Crassaminicella profunda TaxID=1286698 RepID=UPI001CA73006|nr:hypothetical protein [Crassaminicella profunda]QZY56456.1 hypothetical protein K7H06_05895 [Crassaminicella profunda]